MLKGVTFWLSRDKRTPFIFFYSISQKPLAKWLVDENILKIDIKNTISARHRCCDFRIQLVWGLIEANCEHQLFETMLFQSHQCLLFCNSVDLQQINEIYIYRKIWCKKFIKSQSIAFSCFFNKLPKYWTAAFYDFWRTGTKTWLMRWRFNFYPIKIRANPSCGLRQ